jgi:hypothetical protein
MDTTSSSMALNSLEARLPQEEMHKAKAISIAMIESLFMSLDLFVQASKIDKKNEI